MQVNHCVLIFALLAHRFHRNVTEAARYSRPHIIYILADDMGWNDVGFTGRSELQTPNIDALAHNGRILTQHYALPSCTPSRSALLTGKYPTLLGMQGYPLSPTEPRGMPLDQKLFPQYMKDLGYQTHLVGKWHLGYYDWRYTPTARKAFDSHFGYMNGFIGYYDHIMEVRGQRGHDFWHNAEPLYNLTGQYVTHLLTQEAVRLINAAAPSQNADPLFLLLSHLAPHAGNPGKELEYPAEDIERFGYIIDEKRRKYAAMVWSLDQSVGQVVQALSDNNMLRDSIIVFVSDNGAQTIGMYENQGSNFPLQGLKFSIQDGGVRTLAAVWSPLLHGGGRGVCSQLFHITDWFPTLYYAAGGNMREISAINGRNQWPALLTPSTGQVETDEYTTRQEILVNIDEVFGQEALIYRQYKLLKGTYRNGIYDGVFDRSVQFDLDSKTSYIYNANNIVGSRVSALLRSQFPTFANDSNINEQRNKVKILCNAENTGKVPVAEQCDLKLGYCLFDIRADPCERVNLADNPLYADTLNTMKAKLQTYNFQRKNQLNLPNDDSGADPKQFNGTWVCWRSGMPNSLLPQFGTTKQPDHLTTQFPTSAAIATEPQQTPTVAATCAATFIENTRNLTGVIALLCLIVTKILLWK